MSSPSASDQRSTLIIDGWKYDITNFIKKHPGGNVIKFYDGFEATDVFRALHYRSQNAEKWLKSIPREQVTCIGDGQDPLVSDFRKLRKELEEEGAFKPMAWVQTFRILEILFLYVLSFIVANRGYLVLAILIRGLYVGRNGLVMHEMGHRAFTGNIKIDKVLHWLTFTAFITASATFWNNQHNKHHAATQEYGADTDLNTLPLVAFNKLIAKGGARWVLRIQWLTFIPFQLLIFPIWKITHTRHMFRTKNIPELLAVICNHTLEFYMLSSSMTLFGYMTYWLMAVMLGGLYLTSVFSLNHTHKPVVDNHTHRDWVRRSAGFTTNLTPNFLTTWFTGYLNFQIEHHMFPQMPHPRLPQIAPRIKALLLKHNVEYDCRGMSQAFVDVIENLYQVGHFIEKTKDL